MNRKEIAEIKRRMDVDKGVISCVRGCYVSAKGEVISTFCREPITLPREEADRYMSFFKRVLSGTQGQNQMDVIFSPEQVANSDEHKLLMALRDTGLRDDGIVNELYQAIIDSLKMEENYLILLTHDTFDVPFHSRDGHREAEMSDSVFRYFVCCVCPVKLSKPELSYIAPEHEFHNSEPDWVVGAPELGFMFPAFDGRSSNIYNALYFTRNAEEAHTELTDALFKADIPLSAPEQKAAFETVLKEALAEDLNLDVAQAVHEKLCEKIQAAKADKEADAPSVSAPEVRSVLEAAGVAPARAEAFELKYEEEFGRGVMLNAAGIVNPKQFEVRTPSVLIKVAPESSDLLETRILDGKRYILIRAEENVEVNGVLINMDNQAEE